MRQTDGVTSETGQRALDVGLGAGGLATADMVLNIGPQHPATHGVLRLRVVLDGERIISAEPIIGYMHRGAEKLFEVRDYRQITVLANRHDWLSAFSNELGVVLGVEAMLGMEVPERAVWLRTLLAELNRVLSHLMFLGSYPLELGAITPVFYAFREREELQAVMEEASGGRMHYMFNRVGGLKEDVPAGWLGRVEAAVNGVRRRLPELESLISGNEIVEARTRGVGVLDIETCLAYGVSGPIAATTPTSRTPRSSRPAAPAASSPAPPATVWPGSRCCWSRCTSASTSRRPASTCSGCCPPARSTSGCPRCSRCPRASATPPPRTRSGSTGTSWSRAARRPRGA